MNKNIPDCTICLEELFNNKEHPDVIQITKCSHLFHKDCLNLWMKGKEQPKCPLCQGPVDETTVIRNKNNLKLIEERKKATKNARQAAIRTFAKRKAQIANNKSSYIDYMKAFLSGKNIKLTDKNLDNIWENAKKNGGRRKTIRHKKIRNYTYKH